MTKIKQNLQDFIVFIREKGVIGLAIGVIMGGAITNLVNSIVQNIINPLIGTITGAAGNLNQLAYKVPYTEIVFKWGAFLSSLIDFIAIIAVIYFLFMKAPIIRDLDKKKE
jgi:large conductance mechanosensitive channel